MKPSLFLVRNLLLAEEGDYIAVLGDEVVAVIPNPKPKKEAKQLPAPEEIPKASDSILDEIVEIIRRKGSCSALYICKELGIPIGDEKRRAQISAHIKHLRIVGRIRKVEGARRSGPYAVVN
jgi:hypothetical protein